MLLEDMLLWHLMALTELGTPVGHSCRPSRANITRVGGRMTQSGMHSIHWTMHLIFLNRLNIVRNLSTSSQPGLAVPKTVVPRPFQQSLEHPPCLKGRVPPVKTLYNMILDSNKYQIVLQRVPRLVCTGRVRPRHCTCSLSISNISLLHFVSSISLWFEYFDEQQIRPSGPPR